MDNLKCYLGLYDINEISSDKTSPREFLQTIVRRIFREILNAWKIVQSVAFMKWSEISLDKDEMNEEAARSTEALAMTMK
jgi:hypothetical protein